jgi:hypothetical protein
VVSSVGTLSVEVVVVFSVGALYGVAVIEVVVVSSAGTLSVEVVVVSFVT